MEKWNVAFPNMISQDHYYVNMQNGESQGLVLTLQGTSSKIILRFGLVKAIRMLEEGLVQNGIYEDTALEPFKESGFCDVIYVADGGQFENEVKQMADGMWKTITAPKHYIVVTLNYIIDIIASGDPEIVIS